MRVGATIFNQNYSDWDRYEAEERGENVAAYAQQSDREIFIEELDIARIADDTGFDAVWTIEHHFTPYTMVTNPLQYLTYIAGITKRVDLGTMVTVLPWHNPVRVAEDINMLDTFLGPKREIICGVGRGLGRREYEGLSIDQGEARERFDESLQVLNQLLATGKCDFQGKHYQIKGLKLRPQPDRDLSPNLWCAGGTDETVEIIARHGVRPLVIPTTSLGLSLETARKYARLHAKAGFTPSKTKLALWTYVAETEAQAKPAPNSTWCSTPIRPCAITSCVAAISVTSKVMSPMARCRRRWRKIPHPSCVVLLIPIRGARRSRPSPAPRIWPCSLVAKRSCSSSSTAVCR